MKVVVAIFEREANYFEEVGVFSNRELADVFMHKRMGTWVIVETEVDCPRDTDHGPRDTDI